MTKYTTSYTDEYVEYVGLVTTSDGTKLAHYRGEETGENIYFTAMQVEMYVCEVSL